MFNKTIYKRLRTIIILLVLDVITHFFFHKFNVKQFCIYQFSLKLKMGVSFCMTNLSHYNAQHSKGKQRQLSFKFESCLSRRSTKSCLSKLNCFLVLLIHQDSFQHNLNWTKFVHSFGRIIWHHRSLWGIWTRLCQPVQTGEWAIQPFMLAVRNTS